MTPTLINGRWTLNLPEHRAARPEWVTGWEVQRIATMALVIQPTDVVFDIGAEEGDLSALWASWVPEGRVVVVEPNPRVWPNIKAIFEANSLATPSCFVGFAAGTANSCQLDNIWPECAAGPVIGDHGFLNLAEDDGARTTIDHLAAAAGWPNVVTIDVEGAELEVLKGAANVLDDARPEVFVSVHPEFMAHHWRQTPAQLFALMDRHAYRHHLLAADHELHFWFTPR